MSCPNHDYITKLGLYHDAGVREYWIVDAQNKKIDVLEIFDDLSIDFSSLDLDE